MKNTTFADQSDAIRTLTEEEMAVVSGGLAPLSYYSNLVAYEMRLIQNYAKAHPHTVSYPYRNYFVWGNFGNVGYAGAFDAVNSALV